MKLERLSRVRLRARFDGSVVRAELVAEKDGAAPVEMAEVDEANAGWDWPRPFVTEAPAEASACQARALARAGQQLAKLRESPRPADAHAQLMRSLQPDIACMHRSPATRQEARWIVEIVRAAAVSLP